MDGIIIDEGEVEAPEGLLVRNFRDPSVHRFHNATRTPPIANAIILHETVTTSWESTVNVLKQRGLGVHFIVDSDGKVYQHADAYTDIMWHGTLFNRTSVGIEVVNPYEPRFLPKGGSAWGDAIIDAPWAAGDARKYVVPTPSQAEAASKLVDFLSSARANPIAVPQHWPGFQGSSRLSFGRIKADASPNPGIHAHMYFGHGDGAWLVLYSWLRLEVGLTPEDAWGKAVELATGASSAGPDLKPFFDANPYLEV